ncbi:MAG: hypothetical protein AUJ01_16050 [Acidobacteria bacterium 13_1_40CM_3_65_5]|nr:MAG: hypothetical protein AUJ01_16050 [Acidobacteria bacterium 13_1_40CM_3_65_5]
MQETSAAPPFARGHVRVAHERALDRAAAGAGSPRQRAERRRIVGARAQQRRDARGARIARHRQLQRHGRQRRQLIEEHTDQVRVRRRPPIERTKPRDVQHELAQQARHVHHPALAWQRVGDSLREVQHPHRDRRVHPLGVSIWITPDAAYVS